MWLCKQVLLFFAVTKCNIENAARKRCGNKDDDYTLSPILWLDYKNIRSTQQLWLFYVKIQLQQKCSRSFWILFYLIPISNSILGRHWFYLCFKNYLNCYSQCTIVVKWTTDKIGESACSTYITLRTISSCYCKS